MFRFLSDVLICVQEGSSGRSNTAIETLVN